MLVWIIVGAVLLLITLILISDLRIRISYQENLRLRVHFLCFFYTVLPRKEEQLRPKDFTTKALIKKKKKRLKAQNKKKATVKKSIRKQEKQRLDPKELPALIRDVTEIFADIPKRALRYLRLHLGHFCLIVGTQDAANTALLTGAATEGVRAIEVFLCEQIRYRRKHGAQVSVIPDFVTGTTSAQVRIELRIRLWQALTLGVNGFYCLLQFKKRKQDKNQKEAIK